MELLCPEEWSGLAYKTSIIYNSSSLAQNHYLPSSPSDAHTMASILPPLDPRIITPPGADEITDGVYIIGWHLGKNLEDTIKLPNTSLTPAVEIASVNSLSSLSGEGKFPVLVENIIDGVQPEGQYVCGCTAFDLIDP